MEKLINKVHNSKYTYGEFVYKMQKRRIYLFAVIIKINMVMKHGIWYTDAMKSPLLDMDVLNGS